MQGEVFLCERVREDGDRRQEKGKRGIGHGCRGGPVWSSPEGNPETENGKGTGRDARLRVRDKSA
jgi:hypothetical protein